MPLVAIIVGVALVIFLYIVVIYNRLIALRNNREQAFSDIDVQMKQRYDLVPNLVSVVKGYAKHEKSVFENIAKARSQALGAGSIDDKIASENKFASTLKTVFAVAEKYPELKANSNFIKLQDELSDLENKIAAARRFFNNTTKELNTVLLSFPVNLLNALFRFEKGKFFEVGPEAAEVRESITVKLDE